MTDHLAEPDLQAMKRPPVRGPGSSRDAWMRYCLQLSEANVALANLVEAQAAKLKELQARLDKRKPGGRPRTPEQTVQRIASALKRGESMSAVAMHFGVSKMTVSRIRRRVLGPKPDAP